MNDRKPRPVKVLHVIDSFGTGGAETWLLHVAEYVKHHSELGLHVDFLATGGSPSVYDEAVLQAGANIFYIKYSMKRYFSFRKQLLKLLKQEKYDAIHDHQDFISGLHFLTGIGALPATRITHLHNPYNFIHNYVINPFRWLSFRMGRLLTVSLTKKITGTSDAVMDEYGYNKWPYKKKRVRPAYCGFETTRFKYDKTARTTLCSEWGWQADQVKIALYVARIGLQQYDTAKNQKNPEFAFELAKELVSRKTGWKFVFVGFKGLLGESMEGIVLKDGLADSIKFLGIRNDVPAIMSCADVLVFPSFWEGLGMVAVEAQASGLPVIMSDSVPTEAIVAEQLVTRKDLQDGTPAWADAIQQIGSVSVEREKYAAVIGASHFSIRNSVEYLVQLYRN